MSDTGNPSTVRPMTSADYPDDMPAPADPSAPREHPTRDLIVGAVVGAAALWAVPRLLDYATDYFTGGGEGLELEEE